MYIIITSTIITIVGLTLYINYRKKKKLELIANNERKDFNNRLNNFLSSVNIASIELQELMSKKEYINHLKTYKFKAKYQDLYNRIPFNDISKLAYEGETKQQIEIFKFRFNNLIDIIDKRNLDFIESELEINKVFFDNIECKSLDNQQRKAIILDEDNNIIVAGAGSGKTTTIVGKVKYLIDNYHINPNEILLISFTRKAADEMRNRIQKNINVGIDVKTFHKLGLDIISKSNNEKPSIIRLSQKETLELFASFIANNTQNSDYFNRILNFCLFLLKPYKEETEFETESERTNYLIDQKYEGLKLIGNERIKYSIINNHDLQGLKLIEKKIQGLPVSYREKLKSQEEVLIANFLFLNNIEYSYEERFQYKTASTTFGQYKPDFYLPEYNIYIEHFAIDQSGNVPNWFKGDDYLTAKEKYNNGIAWKRELFELYNMELVETYSWEKRDGILLTNLENKLKKRGVVFNPKSDEEVWAYMKKNTSTEIENFTTLVHTFLVLYKSNNLSIEKLKTIAANNKDERALAFIEIFIPILNSYEIYLKETGEIDFNDMINNAIIEVNKKNYISPYKYIIIDEFQDISLSRYLLIKSLLDQNAETKLFSVGDDWQSIYRFAGSDIGIFTEFENYFKTTMIQGFERKTAKSYIENTYRFDNQLINTSSNFILKNTNQIAKNLKSFKQTEKKPITILKYDFNSSIINPLHIALDSISTIVNSKETTILLLGRYEHEIKEIKEKSRLKFNFNQNSKEIKITHPQYPHFKIDFLTVHSAKGLEADFVIILNGNAGKYGFPSEISDDPLLNFLLSKSDQFPNGEERRVFYVALTRAKEHIYILTNNETRSKFIDEIEVDEKIEKKHCNWCDNGILIERKGPFGYFYACSNIHYCNYSCKIAPSDFIEKADSFYKEKNYSQAIAYYTKALENDNNNYLSYYNRGRCFEESGDKVEALSDYNQSIILNDKNSSSYYWRGSVHYDMNNYTNALSDWQKADEINPQNKSTLYWLAKTQFKLGQIDLSIEYINRYIEKNSNDKEAYVFRGVCCAKKQLYNSAFNDWQTAKNLGSSNIDYYLNHYNVNKDSKDYTKEIIIDSTDINVKYNAISNAIIKNQLIQFSYQKSNLFSNGASSKRTIKPLLFEQVGVSESLCVKGYCYMRNEDRVFSLERITNLIINPSKIDFWEQ
ncbi:MAG: UvrD-helicase domain-containing protein [Bacteroidales bacterium]|nr:UvrD-helicase domain-containing protein [Bacteroidales bacterium]